MFHGIPNERADHNLDIYLPTKGPPAVDMSRTLCSNLNVMAMADFPLVLASEKFFLKSQITPSERVTVTMTMTDSVEGSAAAILHTSYSTVLQELKSCLKLSSSQLLILVNIAEYLGS